MKIHALTSESFSLNKLERLTVQIEFVCNHRTPVPTSAESNYGCISERRASSHHADPRISTEKRRSVRFSCPTQLCNPGTLADFPLAIRPLQVHDRGLG